MAFTSPGRTAIRKISVDLTEFMLQEKVLVLGEKVYTVDYAERPGNLVLAGPTWGTSTNVVALTNHLLRLRRYADPKADPAAIRRESPTRASPPSTPRGRSRTGVFTACVSA